MRRRTLITLLGGAAAWPLAARAQQPALPLVGVLGGGSLEPYARKTAAWFREGLKEIGYVEGRNVAIETPGADNENDRLPALAAELVRRQATVILATSTPAALAAKAATTSTPIIFAISGDPVELALVGSLNRPGGNITGVTVLSAELAPKQLELLHALAPAATIIAVLTNPASPALAESQLRHLKAAADKSGLQLHLLGASSDRDLDSVFASLATLRASALLISADLFFSNRLQKLADLSTRHSIPAVYWQRDFAASGGLMSYGSSPPEAWRQVGIYAGRILKGEKPADLPVVQAVKVELVINLKTAKALGITMPTALLVRADEVIE